METAASEVEKMFQTDSYSILADFQTWLQETGQAKRIIPQLLETDWKG